MKTPQRTVRFTDSPDHRNSCHINMTLTGHGTPLFWTHLGGKLVILNKPQTDPVKFDASWNSIICKERVCYAPPYVREALGV